MSGPLSLCVTMQSLPYWNPAVPTSTVLHPPVAPLRCLTPVGTNTGLQQGWAPSWQRSNTNFLLACPFLQGRTWKPLFEQGRYKIHPNHTTSIWAAWEADPDPNLNPQQLQPHHSTLKYFLCFCFFLLHNCWLGPCNGHHSSLLRSQQAVPGSRWKSSLPRGPQ